MEALIVADGHYFITPQGEVFAESVYDYNFYKRYLQTFDHLYVVIRAQEIDYIPKSKKTSGEGITFLRLPSYRGPYEYLKKFFKIKRSVKEFCKKGDCAIFRIPAATSNTFCKAYKMTKKPFAVEVVIDPWENFGPRADGNKAMLYYVRRSWTRTVKKMCARADGASYVTREYLQRLYPPKSDYDKNAFTSSYSSVEIPDDSFGAYRTWDKLQKKFTISHVSNDWNTYGKGHLVLMDAVKMVRDKGHDVGIRFVGDGLKAEEFKNYAKKIGILEHVEFMGRLANGNEVRKAIASTDIHVLPTFAEGLPRVLIEAMSEGLPCLSSPTCGIPEILEDRFLYDFDDREGFAKGIIQFIENPELMTKEGKRNLELSKQFSSSLLNKKRKEFYNKLRETTEKRMQK